MSKKIKNVNDSGSVTVIKSHKKANIAVAIVVGIAVLILIAVAVLCSVRVDPLDGLNKPEQYELYNAGGTDRLPNIEGSQSKIRNAMDDMDFSVMSAILQWSWDYSYNFVRNSDGEKITMSAKAIEDKLPASNEYMVEFIYRPVTIIGGQVDYNTAQSLKVDGETIYFDRVKVIIGNTDGSVGDIYLYPYIYDRVYNKAADNGATYAAYNITAVKVRANTTDTYAALKDLVSEINRG